MRARLAIATAISALLIAGLAAAAPVTASAEAGLTIRVGTGTGVGHGGIIVERQWIFGLATLISAGITDQIYTTDTAIRLYMGRGQGRFFGSVHWTWVSVIGCDCIASKIYSFTVGYDYRFAGRWHASIEVGGGVAEGLAGLGAFAMPVSGLSIGYRF